MKLVKQTLNSVKNNRVPIAVKMWMMMFTIAWTTVALPKVTRTDRANNQPDPASARFDTGGTVVLRMIQSHSREGEKVRQVTAFGVNIFRFLVAALVVVSVSSWRHCLPKENEKVSLDPIALTWKTTSKLLAYPEVIVVDRPNSAWPEVRVKITPRTNSTAVITIFGKITVPIWAAFRAWAVFDSLCFWCFVYKIRSSLCWEDTRKEFWKKRIRNMSVCWWEKW